MKYLSTIILVALLSACATNSARNINSSTEGFDRETALVSHKDQCSLNLILAMGLSAQKEQGEPRAKLEAVAVSSKNPELMVPMVPEIFGSPQLQGRTYTFFKYDNCLISKAMSQPLVSLESVRSGLVQCESIHQEMEGLIGCIDRTIINANKQS